jgi:hypothetical protein
MFTLLVQNFGHSNRAARPRGSHRRHNAAKTPPQRRAELLHRCSSSSSDSNFEPNGVERANTRVIHKFTEFFLKWSGKKICLAMSPQKINIQLYRW